MQTYDIQISSASDVERIFAQGDYIYYLSGSAGGSSDCIEVRGVNTSFRVKLKPGQGMRLPMGQVEKDWIIKPEPSIAGSLYGAVVIGEGEIFDNRITGTVDVVDGGKNRTLAGQAFLMPFARTSTVGNLPFLQMRNPVNSGRNAFIKAVTFTLSQSGFVQIGSGGPDIGVLNSAAQSKDAESIGSGVLGSYWLDSPTVQYGTNFMAFIRVAANTSFSLKFDEPIALRPGKKLNICGSAVNADMGGFFEYIEESI